MPGSARSRPCRLFLFVSQIRNEGRMLSGQTSGVGGCFCPVLNNVVYLSYPLAKFLFRCYDFIKYFLWGALFQERFTEKTCRSSQPSGRHSPRHVPCFILTQERKPMSYTRRGFLKLAGVSALCLSLSQFGFNLGEAQAYAGSLKIEGAKEVRLPCQRRCLVCQGRSPVLHVHEPAPPHQAFVPGALQ